MTQLVLVHGFMGGSAQWDGYVDGLAGQFDIIAVDLPGFGKRAHLQPIDSIGGYADWVIQHLRSLGVDRYHLLGHSMGGMIAQELALRDGERIDQLVLYATGAIGVLPGRFETIEDSKRRAAEDGPAATARRIAATWFLHREAADGFEQCAAIAAETPLVSMNAGLDAMSSWSAEQNLERILQKTLVFWGDCDRTYPWSQIEMLWKTIPSASLAVVPGCAHAVHAEKPDMFQRLLSDFLH
ncbi:alpha/beta fold hydrolase [Lutimaribacter marinistellae]|uniref:Alpha/beta fold hydrolase n=1 Tax=Lutimaribacter marinistellae TaxID=1820329 RepID=A0ABV7TKM9_9RHOB